MRKQYDKKDSKQDKQNTESTSLRKDKNPFKEASAPAPEESSEEEAAAEQQRKEALTERD